jgi:hypothetical protein
MILDCTSYLICVLQQIDKSFFFWQKNKEYSSFYKKFFLTKNIPNH